MEKKEEGVDKPKNLEYHRQVLQNRLAEDQYVFLLLTTQYCDERGGGGGVYTIVETRGADKFHAKG